VHDGWTATALVLRIEPSGLAGGDLEEIARKLTDVELLSEEEIGHMPHRHLTGAKTQ
jgi:hypothetical protein